MSEAPLKAFNPFADAIVEMDRNGWRQGLPQIEDPKVCLMEAVSLALADQDEQVDVDALRLMALHFGGIMQVIRFNDDPHTTEEDVRLELKRMARIWEGE